MDGWMDGCMHLFVFSIAYAYYVRVASDSDVVYYTYWSLLTLCVSPPVGLRQVVSGFSYVMI